MAKCILSEDLRNAGIIGISGIVSREKPTKDNPNPVRVLMSMRNGVQHISIGRKPVRSTAPSVEELQRRELFARANAAYAALSPDEIRRYQVEGHNARWKFNGKQYQSPAGYIRARLYQELKNN